MFKRIRYYCQSSLQKTYGAKVDESYLELLLTS